MKRAARASLGSWKAPSGRPEPVSSPAPAGSSLTPAGMSATAQCQKPEPVDASGSYTVTAKLLVPSGAPLQDSCGETSLPPGTPKAPENCSAAQGAPSATLVLVTVKGAAPGRRAEWSLALIASFPFGALRDCCRAVTVMRP